MSENVLYKQETVRFVFFLYFYDYFDILAK